MIFGTPLSSHASTDALGGGFRPLRQAARRLLFCGLLVISMGQLVADARGADWTVEALMALLQEQREPSVAFEEATYSSLLTEPLKVRGLLRFIPPVTLEKIITDPFHERYLVEGDRVTFESQRKGVTRTISLDEYPGLRTFIDAFRMSLNGDAIQLRRLYEVTLEGSRARWTLLLRPREPSGKSVVDYILLTGSSGRIGTIAIRAPDGDRSVMTLIRGVAR
jgi:hypothetical protein